MGHNPVWMLGRIQQERLEEAVQDDGFLAHMDRVNDRLRSYMDGVTWYARHCAQEQVCIAYFSSEFGITECMPFSSGGLGVLSGDHLKAASDVGIPMAGVGLLYQEGYFHQYLTADGWQQESYPENDFYTMPIQMEEVRPD